MIWNLWQRYQKILAFSLIISLFSPNTINVIKRCQLSIGSDDFWQENLAGVDLDNKHSCISIIYKPGFLIPNDAVAPAFYSVASSVLDGKTGKTLGFIKRYIYRFA